MALFVVVVLLLFHGYVNISIETLKIILTSTNIHGANVCDSIDPYILLINDCIDQITLIGKLY